MSYNAVGTYMLPCPVFTNRGMIVGYGFNGDIKMAEYTSYSSYSSYSSSSSQSQSNSNGKLYPENVFEPYKYESKYAQKARLKKEQEEAQYIIRMQREHKEREEREQKEREQKESEQKERERKEIERKERERKERERKEIERKEKEQKESEQKESEQKERERKEIERKERERKEIERKERERKEIERKEKEQKESEQKERERKERLEKERLEKENIDNKKQIETLTKEMSEIKTMFAMFLEQMKTKENNSSKKKIHIKKSEKLRRIIDDNENIFSDSDSDSEILDVYV
jgi:hypothetical protein